MPRFYCPHIVRSGECCVLPAAAARHVQVLRLQPGAVLTLFNGQGGEWSAQVVRMGRSDVAVEIGMHSAIEREAARPLHLLVGMPANERMDGLIEKATELGVASVQPLLTERSVLKLSGERAAKRQAHWQAIAIAACEQCGRNQIPTVHLPLPLAQWYVSAPHPLWERGWGVQEKGERAGIRLVLSLRPGSKPLHQILRSAPAAQPVWLLHGPEGGLTAQEEATALAHSFVPASLGARVLRADTAALAALALAM